ncbi:hypothetical protein P4S55_24815 [Shewanella sp. PP-Sp27a-2]
MKFLFNVFRNSTVEMQNALICIFITLIFILKLTLEFYGTGQNLAEYFKGNLLPELTGMTIELIIVLLFIDAIRKREEISKDQAIKSADLNQRIELERRLRSQLRLLTRSIFSEVELDSGYLLKDFLFHAVDHEVNRQVLTEIERGLSEEIDTSAINENLINSAKFELPILMSLASTSSLLSDRHMKDWMAIIYYLKLIAESSVEDTKVPEHAINVVRWIKVFDKHTYSQNLFKS